MARTTIFFAIATISFSLYGCVGDRDADRTLKSWMPYLEDVESTYLSDGRSVFVFVYAELNPASPAALKSIDFSKLANMAGDDGFVALLHRYDDWSDARIRSIWKDVGHTKKPFVVHYVSGQEPRALDPFTLKPLVVRYN